MIPEDFSRFFEHDEHNQDAAQSPLQAYFPPGGYELRHASKDALRRLFVSLKQNAFDELRDNRSDLDLHVPLLSICPGMDWHVL